MGPKREIANVPDFHKRILFIDEAYFCLNGYVHKQNCRIWSEANPQVYVETPLHPEKLTVWCALWAGEIIGLYFFKNDEGHNVTVNSDRYRAMITYFFIPELNNHDVQELGFQQDGATCHTARATIDLLKDTLGDRLISRFGPVNWPPRSCDLTPLDYFLWGYLKSLVYADKPQTLDHLEDNIRRVIADIQPQMLEKVIENWTSRLDYIRDSRGSHMPEIIFKISLDKQSLVIYLLDIVTPGGVVDAYVPPEGDGKISAITGPGMKQMYDVIGKKGKSFMALRRIRDVDYEFDLPSASLKVQDIYIEAQKALAANDEDKLHDLVTEKAYPEMFENVKNKTIVWKFIQQLEHPRIVHIRTAEMGSKTNMFAQITVRLHTQQILAIYDRFGRLMHGSEDTVKDVLEYVVLEKHLTLPNSTWKIHGKIIPDWMPPKESIKKTYYLPDIDKEFPEPPEKSLQEGDSITFSPPRSGVTKDIPLTHTMSGVSYPKRDRGNKSF
ncbi:probable 39S ribosomal protein L45, mitochondrial [Trichonephila clavipes]|nr:probable 39S ribosomal protein L45, mitochondrial [Trichonephila clavipes]